MRSDDLTCLVAGNRTDSHRAERGCQPRINEFFRHERPLLAKTRSGRHPQKRSCITTALLTPRRRRNENGHRHEMSRGSAREPAAARGSSWRQTLQNPRSAQTRAWSRHRLRKPTFEWGTVLRTRPIVLSLLHLQCDRIAGISVDVAQLASVGKRSDQVLPRSGLFFITIPPCPCPFG